MGLIKYSAENIKYYLGDLGIQYNILALAVQDYRVLKLQDICTQFHCLLPNLVKGVLIEPLDCILVTLVVHFLST